MQTFVALLLLLAWSWSAHGVTPDERQKRSSTGKELCNMQSICRNVSGTSTSQVTASDITTTSATLTWNNYTNTNEYCFVVATVVLDGNTISMRNTVMWPVSMPLSTVVNDTLLNDSLGQLSQGTSYEVAVCHSISNNLHNEGITLSNSSFLLEYCGSCSVCFTTTNSFLRVPSISIQANSPPNTISIQCNVTGDPTPSSIDWIGAINNGEFNTNITGNEDYANISNMRCITRGSFDSTLTISYNIFTAVECVAICSGVPNQRANITLIPMISSSSTLIPMSSSNSDALFYIFIFVIPCILIFCIIVIVIIVVRKTCKKKTKPAQAKVAYHVKESQSINEQRETVIDPLLASLSHRMRIPSSDIQISTVIGQGEFGVVYKGTLRKDGIHELVAVKTMKALSLNCDDTKKMIDEVLKMEQFDHPNVMSLIGVCMDSDGGGRPCIVMPFMGKGSLLEFLRKNRSTLIPKKSSPDQIDSSTRKLLSMCWQIAKGMEYLAGAKFVHRDLAARNCMIAADDTIKVADFGLTEDIYTQDYFKESSSEAKLPIKWMAIESIKMCIFSEKTDVWSYGVTCWEVFSVGETPYPGIHPQGVLRYLSNGGRLSKPSNPSCTDEIYETMLKTWEEDGEARPTFSTLVTTLESCLQAQAQYLALNTVLA